MNPTLAHITSQFNLIDERDYQEKVRFYHDNYGSIMNLNESKRNYFKFRYVEALFELGRYELVLTEIDPLIEFVFTEEHEYNENKTFEYLIFKKAASYLNVCRFEEAINVSKELVGIDPNELSYRQLLLKCLRSKKYHDGDRWRMGIILLILVSALISAFTWSLSGTVLSPVLKILFFSSLSLNVLAFGSILFQLWYNHYTSQKELYALLYKQKAPAK